MKVDVAIVGAGPVGLTLALLLARWGVRVAVLERQPRPYPLPRAVHFDGEAMRIFQAAGVAEQMSEATMVGRGMLFKDAEGRVLVDWSREQSIGETGWYESYRCHQPAVEAVLRQAVEERGIDLRDGVAVIGLSQTDDAVQAATSDGQAIHAQYVVGCDGANSFVRGALDVDLTDLGFEEDWLVVDLMLTRPRPDLGDYSVQHCDAQAAATYVRGVGDRRRWEIRLEERGRDTVPEAEVWRRLARWITPDDARLERAAVYTFRSCVAERWQVGRVFLAGDAAHQMPPFMGQGMCCGLRDAGNLAWKLAQSVQGGEDVLASYESERGPHLRDFVDLSVNLGRLINQTAAAGSVPAGQMKSIWPQLGPGLGPRDGIAGRLAPQVFVEGQRADDVVGGGMYALVRSEHLPGVTSVVDTTGWLEDRGLAGVIVRPDGYVLEGWRPGEMPGLAP